MDNDSFTDAMKSKKFDGLNFKRWSTKLDLWLTTMARYYGLNFK